MGDDNSAKAEVDDPSKYDIYCNLCKTGFSSTVSYRQHLKGSKHTKAEKKEFMKDKYGKKYAEAVAKMKETDGRQEGAQDSTRSNALDDDDDTVVMTCDVCKKVCTGIIPYQSHVASKAHAKQVRKQKLTKLLKMEHAVSDTGVPEMLEQLILPFATCSACKKSFSGPEGYQQHMSSESHRKSLRKIDLIAQMEKNHLTKPAVDGDSDEFEPVPLATCDDCGKIFYDPIPYQQHMSSGSHKKNVRKLKLMQKLKPLVLENSEEGSVACADCGKVFSGPHPLYQHLAGSAHSKQKQKEELLSDLLEKFPELLKESKSNTGSDYSLSDDGDGDILVCTVCHKSFSGPESARDHFRSKRHLKARKEKDKIKKLLQKRSGQVNGRMPAASTLPFASPSSDGRVKSANTPKSRQDSFGDDFEVVG